jgi:dihydrofolate reductase
MRDLVVHAWTSVDGFNVDEGTEVFREMDTTDDPVGEELFAARLAAAGAHIMGRVSYLEMAEHWPGSTDRNAAPMNEVPKVVFSRTLPDSAATWGPVTIARGDTAAEITRLKAKPGGPVIAHGGTQFVRSLTALGVVDEYRFYMVPFAAGSGVPLFTADAYPGRLRLAGTTAYPGGILELVYRPHRG